VKPKPGRLLQQPRFFLLQEVISTDSMPFQGIENALSRGFPIIEGITLADSIFAMVVS
jgi:hypothetical protein